MNIKTDKTTDIKNCFDSLESLSLVKQNETLLKRLTEIKEKFERKTFQLVILGQFKRGKTSLINALVGTDLLPTAIVPLTSIITILKYGNQEKITTSFLNGNNKKIRHSELAEYITETKNPKNKKEVEKVVIEYPLDFLKPGIQIIDTPGVGSVYKHNTDVAYEFVPKADAGIFVVTADPPISESELSFLKSIKDYLSKIVFVQNKIDQVNEKERRESFEFTRKTVEETTEKKNLTFFQLSAKLALEAKLEEDGQKLTASNIVTLEESLREIFTKKKDSLLLLSVISKLLPIVTEIDLALQVEKKALQMSVNELKEKANTFSQEADKIKQEREDDSFILQGQAQRLTEKVLIDDIEALKEKELPRLTQEFETFFQKEKHLSGKELKNKFNKFLKIFIKSVFKKWRKEEETKLQDTLKNIINRFSSQANQYIARIIDLSTNLFDLKLKKFEVDTALAKEVEFRFAFDEHQVDIDFYTPLITKLPKFISNKILYNNMKEEIYEKFDQHCGRSRYDFHERIMKSLYEYQNSLDETLDQTILSVEKALSKALLEMSKKEEYRDKAKLEIGEQENLLDSISGQLEETSTKLKDIS